METNLADGFGNFNTGLGGKNDTRTGTGYYKSNIISQSLFIVNDLFNTNWIARKVVTTPIKDSFKEGRNITSLEPNNLKLYNKAMVSYDKKIIKALTSSFVEGGSFLLAVGGGALSDELNLLKGELINIAVLSRRDVTFWCDMNILSPIYLSPTNVVLMRSGEIIHPSRLFFVDGIEALSEHREMYQGFGLSLYDTLYQAIQDASVGSANIRNLLDRAKQDTIKLKGFNKAMASSNENGMIKRLEALSLTRSLFNTAILDGEDEYTSTTQNFTGIPDVLMSMYLVVAGASNIPLTKLVGKSADGQNATGKGDRSDYYDYLKSDFQSDRIAEIYEWLDPIITKHLFNQEMPIEYTFNPLEQKTELELLTIKEKRSNILIGYIDSGVMSAEEVRDEVAKSGDFDLGKFEEVEVDEK